MSYDFTAKEIFYQIIAVLQFILIAFEAQTGASPLAAVSNYNIISVGIEFKRTCTIDISPFRLLETIKQNFTYGASEGSSSGTVSNGIV